MGITGGTHGKNGKFDVSEWQIQHESAIGVPVAVDIFVGGFFSPGLEVGNGGRDDIVECISAITEKSNGPIFFGNEIHVTNV